MSALPSEEIVPGRGRYVYQLGLLSPSGYLSGAARLPKTVSVQAACQKGRAPHHGSYLQIEALKQTLIPQCGTSNMLRSFFTCFDIAA